MRVFLAALAALMLTACSDSPGESKVKAPEPPPQALSGRQAFQKTYPAARLWAGDCQPVRIRSVNLSDPKSSGGKAGAWEVVYVSAARGLSRTYTWSAVEGGNLHEGVSRGPEESSSAPGEDKPFLAAAIRTDTPEALATATEQSAAFLKKPGNKPQVNFILESTSRFPDPAWRVFWGQSVSAADWSVFVDASTGRFLGQ